MRRDETLRTQLLAGGDALLLSVGRISEEKRLRILLDAFALVRDRDPAVRLVPPSPSDTLSGAPR